jgi:hypothetical protein
MQNSAGQVASLRAIGRYIDHLLESKPLSGSESSLALKSSNKPRQIDTAKGIEIIDPR